MAEWKELCPPPPAEMVWVIFWDCLEHGVICCGYWREGQESEPTDLPQSRETLNCSPAEWCHLSRFPWGNGKSIHIQQHWEAKGPRPQRALSSLASLQHSFNIFSVLGSV